MIYVFGDIIQDEYVYGESTRLSPEAPVPVIKHISTQRSLGGAGNVYENIKSLGSPVSLKTVNNGSDICKQRIYANGHYIARIDYNDDSGIWKNQIPDIRRDDVIVVSDYNKGSVTRDLLDKFLNQKVIVDPKKPLDFYSGAWCVKPNRNEFESYAGKWKSTDELISIMQSVRDDLKIEHLIVTLGSDGAAIVSSELAQVFPSKYVDVSDVTGAGDTFTAVLAHSIHSGMSMCESIKLANIGASVAVSHHGVYVLNRDDLKQEKLIFTNGCFDILHIGHIKLLNKCKSMGKTVVAINSDESIRRLKGIDRPINGQDARKQMLEELGFDVIIFDEDTPYNLIKQIKPDVIVKGGDYSADSVVGNDIAKVEIFPYENGYSTSKIIERISK